MKASDMSPAVTRPMAEPLNGAGTSATLIRSRSRGEQHQHDRETERGTEAVDHGLDEAVLFLHVDQRDPEHGTVGGDQRQGKCRARCVATGWFCARPSR